MDDKGVSKRDEKITQYNISLEEALNKQIKAGAKMWQNGRWINATRDKIMQCLNANNYNEGIS